MTHEDVEKIYTNDDFLEKYSKTSHALENLLRRFNMSVNEDLPNVSSIDIDECSMFEVVGHLNDGRKFRWLDVDSKQYIEVIDDVSSEGMTESQWRKEFARRLRRRMENCLYNVFDLSQRSGISDNLIRKYLRGECAPSARTIAILTKALHCTTADLIEF